MSNTWHKLRDYIIKILFPKQEKKEVKEATEVKKTTKVKEATKIKKATKVKKEKKEKDYLSELLENLKQAQKNQKSLPFQIKSVEQNGFIIKIQGLFAFVSFHTMPWKYKSIEQWELISKHLIGTVFYGRVYSISKKVKPIKITVNARSHTFPEVTLTPSESYQCIVIEKIKSGLIVDLGYHFDWRYGSLQGFVHKSTYYNDITLLNAQLGDIINIRFHGFKKEKLNDKGLILGNENIKAELMRGELDSWIGSIRTAVLKENEKGKKAFFIEGKFKTSINVHPSLKSTKRRIKNLKVNSTIKCKIIRISKAYNFVSEFVSWD